jgi:hypothetical protein
MNNNVTIKRTLIYIIVAVLLFCLFTSNISIAEAKKKHQQKSDDTKVNSAEPAGNQNDCAAPCGTPFPPGETAATTIPSDSNPPTPPSLPTTIPPLIIGDDKGGHRSSQSGSKGKNLVQIPSKPTDFPDNDVNAIQVYVTSANKDIIGTYHVRGEIKNLSNDTTLQFVKVTAHLYDGSGQPVAVTTCCYADPHDIEPGHTSTFDSFAQKDEISGTPASYRLSFDWR